MLQIYFLDNADYDIIIPPLTFSIRLFHTTETFVKQTFGSTPRTTLAISLSENAFLMDKFFYSPFLCGGGVKPRLSHFNVTATN